MECTIIFFNRTIGVSSSGLCDYYNYHVVWGMLVLCSGIVLGVRSAVTEHMSGWAWVWLGFLLFGLELGAFAFCVIAPFISVRKPNVVFSLRETAVAEQVVAIDQGVVLVQDGNPALPAESVPIGNPVTVHKWF